MKSYSNNLPTAEEVDDRLSRRIDRIEKRVFYAMIVGFVLGAASVGFDVYSFLPMLAG